MTSRARIGILALDTKFPRIPGDVGSPSTWAFPVRIEIVRGATPERVVHARAEGLFDAFLDAARRLRSQGVEAVVTTCGFLTLMQDELRKAAGIPVMTSALMQVPLVAGMLPAGQNVGIVTASAKSLTPAHLAAAAADESTPIEGVDEEGEFARVFLGNAETLDINKANADVVAASMRLVERNPAIGAVVLECANMAPYARSIRKATNRPVYDMVGLVNWLHAGLLPPIYQEPDKT